MSAKANLVEKLCKMQEKNPLTTSLMLNSLKGGPLEGQVMVNFDIFTKPLTDFVISASKK